MWIIVDGYNVIRHWPELARLDRADLESGREALLAELRLQSDDAIPRVIIARTHVTGRLRAIPSTADGHFIKLDAALEAAIVSELEAELA